MFRNSAEVELLQHLLPSQSQLRLKNWSLDATQKCLTLAVTSVQPSVRCPGCQEVTHRVHSRYQRALQDLPCSNYAVTLVLQARKFFCINPACQRRIFTERFPQVTEPWARRTCRFAQRLIAIGLALGGAAGSRLSQQVGHPVSLNPLLKMVSRLPMPAILTPRTLGVDDFAFRKCRTYGTILVDLDRNRPIALLPDRESETLSQWLQQYPGVQVLSRDRSTAYKQGMTQGAPEAVQVADRFHLLQNITEVLQQILRRQGRVLKLAPVSLSLTGLLSSEDSEQHLVFAQPSPKTQQQFEQRRTQRLETYQTVWQLHYQGHSTSDIAQQVNLSARTVQRYLKAPRFPERQARSDRGRSLVAPYREYLIQQWNQGHRGMRELFRDLQQQGYPGSYMSLNRYVHRLQQGQQVIEVNAVPQPTPQPVSAQQQTLTARRASYLSLQNPQTRSAVDEQLLHQLIEQNPNLAPAIEIAQAFTQLVRQRQPQQLDIWLQQAEDSDIEAFQRFAKSLKEDYQAVKAGVTLPISNGQVEGQVNRLKMLKRQMYGRANLGLLTRRFLLAV